jgi:guanylate kinase
LAGINTAPANKQSPIKWQRDGCCTDIEMQGVKQMKANLVIGSRYIFIKPPSFKVLEKRLRSRGTEKDEQFKEARLG